MNKQHKVQIEGIITEILPNDSFQVEQNDASIVTKSQVPTALVHTSVNVLASIACKETYLRMLAGKHKEIG
ncbi:hypothetical protein QUB80_16070 [Chlorogloeopsis sp. ULAP01]|uniref:hypothetical protein n=1 Tax=Chlorogloeopsis sp. ULAP01 TaxID=3056483 RepID=UPI0025AA8ACD|nr:hypothetical protein [Chlorogloeopsis sp. ULAP01]MDM9382221.1 hypothetical protein [Chlorogloeopsis sp. ULAP01]